MNSGERGDGFVISFWNSESAKDKNRLKRDRSRAKAISGMAVLITLSGCAAFGGERVGDNSGTVQTSLLPASVPYYLDLCGQDEVQEQYLLYSPSNSGEKSVPKGGKSVPKRKAKAKKKQLRF